MRADRLVSTVLLLQARGRVTAAEVAAELEVSVATARRDLEALSSAGVPVYPQQGRGGGWQLVGGARTDLTGLTAGEAEALLALVGRATGADPQAASAVRKVVRALPATFRELAEASADAVLVDQGRWGTCPDDAPGPLAALRTAVVHRRTVRLAYRSRQGTPSTREVDPLGLVDKDGTWYLLARTADGHRTFRVDRVGDVVATGVTFEPPPDLDLADEWTATVATVEAHRSAVRARVRAPSRLLPVLRSHFGTYLDDVEDDGTHVRASVGAHSVTGLAEQLAGWALHVEVLDPPAVRAELARIGAALVERHGPASS